MASRALKSDYMKFLSSERNLINTAISQMYVNIPKESSLICSLNSDL